MSDFSAFFKRNKIKHENRKYVVSPDFVDADGKPIEWEIRRLTTAEDEALRKSCMRQVKVPGRSGVVKTETDTQLYILKLTVASIVYPNLNDKQLQDEWGVMGAENLLREMIAPGEYADLTTVVTEHNGFDISMNELVEEAKN